MSFDIDLDERILDFIKQKQNLSDCDIISLKEKINRIIELSVNHENIKAEKIYVSISAVSEDEIRELNKQYRNIDKVTDVLSFPIFTKQELSNLNNITQIELGDIFICLNVVNDHSKEYGTGLIREIMYMITHGMCHLLGYDHILEDDKIQMRSLEEKILNELGVNKI